MLAVADGSESVVLQPSRPAALLAALLLNANSVVSVEFLQRVIWGEETPAQGKSALHSCVLRLRRLFGKYGISGNMIEAVPGGYRLTADAGTLDLVRFRELLGSAYDAAEPEAELRLLRAALALWQPPLLTNVPSDLLHRDELPRLQEEWLRAIERVFDLELECGRCREAVAEIRSAAHAHPLHERFTEQLMEALDRTGRRAEALAEYRRLKSHLASTLGVDPGPALQRLELAILRGESSGSAEARPPRQPPPALPAPVAPAPPATGADPAPDEAVDGGRVLDSLVGAGLLEEEPSGRYRVHELLRVFTRAAAAGGVGAARPATSAPGPAPPDPPPQAAGSPASPPPASHTEAPASPRPAPCAQAAAGAPGGRSPAPPAPARDGRPTPTDPQRPRAAGPHPTEA
ncbi:AfsR/SARP family transcriptional regulator [Streptomyces sp. NPDC004031]